MKNSIAVFMLASALAAPGTALWASAGDANQQGSNGTVTGAPAPKTHKGHHGHHHKKTASTTSGAATGTSAPGSK